MKKEIKDLTTEERESIIQDGEDIINIMESSVSPAPSNKIKSNEIRFGYFNADRTNIEWICLFFDQKMADMLCKALKEEGFEAFKEFFPSRMAKVDLDNFDMFHTPW